MWYRGKMLYLFVEDGIYLASADHSPISIRTRVWALVDVHKGERVPEILAVRDTKHMIIFATPPKVKRWHRLEKTMNPALAIMNPWTREEISEMSAHSLELPPSMFKLTVLSL